MEVCRAITFINYRIPITTEEEEYTQYATIGFFDGMITERLEIEEGWKDLMPLWEYELERTAKGDGKYSYQNTFCFGNDGWNEMDDEAFWSGENIEKYPLTFVVFLQLRDYINEDNTIRNRCEKYNEVVRSSLHDVGISYSYFTVDKNDFVVCIKSKGYKAAVDAIKQLHHAGGEVVYSYSVFSVHHEILCNIGENIYSFENEKLDSICLKGVGNSFGLWEENFNQYNLTDKYYELCDRLSKELYCENGEENTYDAKIYDILGEDDFRYIARDVKLGRLLRQYAPGGVLCYQESDLKFYLFSSSLVLNTKSEYRHAISEDYKDKAKSEMKKEFQAPLCRDLIENIKQTFKTDSFKDLGVDNKSATFMRAIWQLLQSLKALETQPTKKYDFCSLYEPLTLLIKILGTKMTFKDGKLTLDKELCENKEIYDFVHKISMTLHGTLRTDIRFFQIRDFNVTVHYAPARMRAFYSLWTLQISDYFNKFCSQESNNLYSFIFAPGMTDSLSVKQLFYSCNEKMRLMLITLPEWELYMPQRLCLKLVHEVAHFVGGAKFRLRAERHATWLKVSAMVLSYEMYSFIYQATPKAWKNVVKEHIASSNLHDMIYEIWEGRANALAAADKECTHPYHKKNSYNIINMALSNILRGESVRRIISEECQKINDAISKTFSREDKNNLLKEVKSLREYLNQQEEELRAFAHAIQYGYFKRMFDIVYMITTEAHADLIALLTLELTPSEYIMSFYQDLTAARKDNASTLVARVALVINSIQNGLIKCKNSETECVYQADFKAAWLDDDLFKRIKMPEKNNDNLKDFISDIYNFLFKKEERICNEDIENYRHVYSWEGGTGSFRNLEVDWLNDSRVWNALLEYMLKCFEAYTVALSKEEVLLYDKRAFFGTFKEISNGSSESYVREIEQFLNVCEKKLCEGCEN